MVAAGLGALGCVGMYGYAYYKKYKLEEAERKMVEEELKWEQDGYPNVCQRKSSYH